jgi:hypothetical protein
MMNPGQDEIDKSGQMLIILHLWKKNLGIKRIRANMKQTLGPDASSKVQIAQCMQRFEQGDFSCKDESRMGRPLLSLWPVLFRFLSKYPFASRGIIAIHFRVACNSVKMILAREHGLKTFLRRWLPHQLSEA